MKLRAIDLPPTQRRWRDLSKRRLFLDLTVVPIPSVIIGIVMIILIDGLGPVSQALTVSAGIRGVLSRAECLILGAAAAVTLPSVAESLSILVDWITIGGDFASEEPWGSDASTRILGIALSIGLVPFGLLGGWLFWRLAVRPTVTTVGDVAPLFD
jgi:hypothetical protein